MDVVNRKGGLIELPEIILTQLGLVVGKKVSLSIKEHDVPIRLNRFIGYDRAL